MLRRLVVLGVIVSVAGAAAIALAAANQGSRSSRRAQVGTVPLGPRVQTARPMRARHRNRAITHTRPRRSEHTLRPARRRPGPPRRAASTRCRHSPPPVPETPINHRQWLTGVTITEYYPAPEQWFVGRRVRAPGLPGRHAVDWLYSARGLAMEGDGVDLSGRPAHIAQLGSTGWVNAAGRPTVPVCLGQWSDGLPVWLVGGWRNHSGAVTFPLEHGGWSSGAGGPPLDYGGVTFATGHSLPVRYYRTIAVDPRLIPLGSRVYIPAYRSISGGWFVAQDTGGAIKGRHVDVYRPAPASPSDLGRYMTRQRILVIPPGH